MWLRKSRKEPVLSHISMKNLPESERPYERFQILGAEALSDAELLAIILKTGAKDYTALDLARDLLSECQGNLLNLYEIGYEQLLERRGIGPEMCIRDRGNTAESNCGAFQAHCQNRTRISFIHELSVFHRRLLYGRTPAPQGRGLYGSFL